MVVSAVNPFNPLDWYFQIAGSVSEVWSTARFAYVSVNDGIYARFLITGGTVTMLSDIPSLTTCMLNQTLPAYFAQGLQVTSTSTPAINATYALDDASLSAIGNVARDANSGLGLPLGLTTYNYADITGTTHSFSQTNLINLYVALRNFVAGTTTAVTLLTQKQVATLPSQSVTIP